MRIIVICAFSLTLASCASAGKKIDPADLASFVVGQTTQQDVISKLGPPNGQSSSTDGIAVLSYRYAHAQARAETFIPIAGAFVGGADSERQAVMFFFGPDGKLKNMTQTSGTDNVGTGLVTGSAQ